MKKLKLIIFLSAFLLVFGGCDKDFVEINTNPFELNDMDLTLVFAGSQRGVNLGGWESEHTIVQHFVNPFNQGATLAFNFNADIDLFQNGSWNQYTGIIRTFNHILDRLEGTTDQVNLQSITRIWRVNAMMNIVDHYGNVPYFDAAKAIKGEEFFFPSYDDDAAIYDDLYLELKDAISKLNPGGDYVSADLFYGRNAFYPKTTAATQVEQWKKVGNSLLLRFGMRYSKLNPAKAASIAAEAFNGGVMTANTDNTFVVYDGSLFTNGMHNNLINNNPRFYYAAEPFVNQLKSTIDPRGKYIVASFANPNAPINDPNPDTNIENQFGFPVGLLDSQGPRGTKSGGLNYTQMNINVLASIAAPSFWFTYAEVSLLLAEAAHRGWIPGGNTQAKVYYENAIKADMDLYALYLIETGSTLPAVTTAEKDAYIAHPLVAYNAANALNLINTQYWIVNIKNGGEAWANRRRSGYPALSRNTYNDDLLQNGGDGYVHRFSYPDAELSRNKENYQAAVAKLNGGIDDLITRVFWDVP